MLDENALSLSVVRLARAKECLRDAEIAITTNSFKSSANRSYYCIFHAMRAVLALDRFDSKKHSGIMDNFRLKYIRTEIFPAEFSKIIGSAFVVRNRSDYEDYYIVSKDDVTTQFENAKIFLSAIEDYINQINKKEPTP